MSLSCAKPESIRRLILGDVLRVERYARFLFIVDEEGTPFPLQTRFDAPLNIIAVIGPAIYAGQVFGAALLLEIGLGRARPYHDALAPSGFLPTGRAIQKRRNYRLLGAERFNVLCPYICDVLAKHAEEIVGGWEHKTWNIPSPKTRVVKTGRRKEVLTRTRETEHFRGARISIAFQDTELVSMFCGCDIGRTRKALEAEARLLCYCLRGYANADYTDAELKLYARARASRMRILTASFGPKEGKEYGRLLPHHVAYMYEKNMIPAKNRALFERCASFFRLVDMERVSFFTKLRIEPQNAIPGIDIRVIPARRSSADYLVCELIPQVEKGDLCE